MTTLPLQLRAIAGRTLADEPIVATGVHEHALRKRSYELLQKVTTLA